ncbi:HhH-GPD family protein [Thermococcus barophilus]|uniref:A/G-specific adenine glycosylase n=1 Tax=Thermococcus barophilus TaxID=55802 RepID=UPI0007048ACC|nr:A/G-specific adenine glycosylase [Thermococcus barophilus]
MEETATDPRKVRFFVENLLKWYTKYGRDFPWRKSKNPYHILIAELMLQRTKASQVERVYLEFIEEFPDLVSLSKASQDRVRQYFSKLGLEWRARKVIALAKILVNKYQGEIPCDRDELLSLPGIGEYISAAILSFACNIPIAVVDSNVVRVLSRYFGITPKGEGRRDRRILQLASMILPKENHREYNFAIIDFASEICTPKNPKCFMCPLREMCSAFPDNILRKMSQREKGT